MSRPAAMMRKLDPVRGHLKVARADFYELLLY
jgi:hypothetical protein